MQPGDVVDDRFEIERLAGAGGMGTVYRARDRRAGGPVALKILHAQMPEHVERFEREAAFLAELVHPGLVAFVASGVTGEGQPYLAMEWLEGESLSERLGRGPLSVGEAIDLGRRVAEALQVAHARDVVHRDLKPSNLFLPGRELARVKLLDFGIARVFTPGKTITHTGATLGSPGFMSPEQARAARVDLRSDVFSLACVLFRCLTGQAPFTGDALTVMLKTVTDPAPRLSASRPDAPPALEALLQRMLEKSPDARPQDAAAVAAALGALASAPQLAPPPAPQLALPPAPQVALPPAPQVALPPAPQVAPPPAPQVAPPPAPQLAPPPAAGQVPPIPRWLLPALVAAACLVGVLYLSVMLRACAATLGVSAAPGVMPADTCPAPFLRCAPLAAPDPTHVDGTEALRQATQLALSIDPAAKLSSVTLIDCVDGMVNFRNLRGSFGASYDRPGGGLFVAGRPDGFTAQSVGAATAAPPPGCSARSAYRAAVASGVPRGTSVVLSYSAIVRPLWSLVVDGRPELTRTIEGRTCVVNK